MATPEVTVRGGGIFGLSVAWACLRRGARVRVIERRGIAAGASGGIVGALAPHTPENWNAKKAFQLRSLLMASDYWQEVEDVSGRPSGYARSGRLQPVPDEQALSRARSRAVGAAALWQGHASWQVVSTEDAGAIVASAARRGSAPEPARWLPRSENGWFIHDTLSALIHPRQATLALAGALRRRGGEIIEGEDAPVLGREVLATGYEGLAALRDDRGRVAGTGVKGQAVLLRLGAAGLPQLFVEALHVVPHEDGTVAVGSTTERDFDAPGDCDAASDDLLARARRAVPALAGADEIRRWAGVRPRARSRAPLLGRHPGRAETFVANGGFKIGFGMAPLVGEVMADLVLEDSDAGIPADFGFASLG